MKMSSKGFVDVEFDGPATYRIVVRGALTGDWSDRLAGMAVTTSAGEGAAPRTTLVGALRDAAELYGVLDTLYNLHLAILEVKSQPPREPVH